MTGTPSDRDSRLVGEGVPPVATAEGGRRRGRHVLRDGNPLGLGVRLANGAAHARRAETVDEGELPAAAGESAEPCAPLALRRVGVSWRHALLAGLVCFALWLVLDAPTLMRSAQEAPLGTRRSVAMAVLRPVADVSEALGLSHLVGGADRVIGHTGNTASGVLQVEGVASHRHRPSAAPAGPGRTRVPAVVPSSAPPVTAPDGLAPLAVPTAAAPLRLLVVGDSLGIDVGQPLVNDLAATDVVSAVLDGHIDTGLARPDYFDWQTELQGDLTRYQPQAVVVFIGANDPQSFDEGSTALPYGTAAWTAAYARRVGAFMAEASGSGARVLWIGLPPMADPALNAEMQALNAVAEAQAALHRGVSYFASWPVLSDAQGHFATFLPDASGSEVQVREPDGTHIAAPGAQRLSESAIAFMGHQWGLVL